MSKITAMSLPLPRSRHSPATQAQVCPPSRTRPAPAWWPQWLVTLKRTWAPLPAHDPPPLLRARADFLAALSDLHSAALITLRARIRCAYSMRDLWHLRTALYGELSAQLGEQLANERLALLNRHFPTRSPRSGFAALDAPAR